MLAPPLLQQDLVLVGGGHAHALVLRRLAMNPVAGLRITLISPDTHTPYSGMLPGLVAGHYRFEQTHIDLARLCQWAGVRFIESRVTGLDPQKRLLTLHGRPDVAYDVLSIDIGSQPELDSVPGACEYAVPVKPVAGLWQRWRAMASRLAGGSRSPVIAVVGGGAGSVELVLAMAHALEGKSVELQLFCAAPELLQGYNGGARRAAMSAMERFGVGVQLDSRVSAVHPGALLLESGEQHHFDDLFWCTGAAAAPWVAESGLACDARGFLQITDTLQSPDAANVFAAGDIATQINHPRPKAGVYAVRQGPVLAHNLLALLLGRTLKRHRPQQRFLSLVSLGSAVAVADRGPFHATGKWVWHWKDRIDKKFMDRFETLPELTGMRAKAALPGAVDQEGAICGGCGAKVGAQGLDAVLAELSEAFPAYCTPPGAGDDAALIPGASAGQTVQSLDMLRQLVADPWLMGRIAANHALSDLYACGARPLSALAAITLPFAASALLQRDLKQLLAGALHEFSQVNCLLAGGHSMQGPEMQVGFCVNGAAMDADRGWLGKRGACGGDALVLTKPLGTGVIFAAQMRHLADGRHVTAALEAMLQSSHKAAKLALTYGATACTDITGFGLLGHLVEMLDAEHAVRLDTAALPALPGALDYLRAGVRSTMHDANRAGAQALEAAAGSDAVFDLLFDPQTSGGLLVAVPASAADEFCLALRNSGYAQAAVVGLVERAEAGDARVVLR